MRPHIAQKPQTVWITNDRQEFLSEREAQQHSDTLLANQLPHVSIDDSGIANWSVQAVTRWPNVETATQWQTSLTTDPEDPPQLLFDPTQQTFPCVMVLLSSQEEWESQPTYAAIPYETWLAQRTARLTAVETAIATLQAQPDV